MNTAVACTYTTRRGSSSCLVSPDTQTQGDRTPPLTAQVLHNFSGLQDVRRQPKGVVDGAQHSQEALLGQRLAQRLHLEAEAVFLQNTPRARSSKGDSRVFSLAFLDLSSWGICPFTSGLLVRSGPCSTLLFSDTPRCFAVQSKTIRGLSLLGLMTGW